MKKLSNGKMQDIRYSIGGPSAEGRPLPAISQSEVIHLTHKASTDLSNVVWIGGCERLHFFIRYVGEIAEKRVSICIFPASGCNHEPCLHVFDELSVGSERLSAQDFYENSVYTHVTFKEENAKRLSMEISKVQYW